MNRHKLIFNIRWMFGILPAFLFGAILTVSLNSCSDELSGYIGDDPAIEDERISLPLAISVAPMQAVDPGTRAVEYVEATDDEKKITDFWFIEYNEEGTRVGKPVYYQLTDSAHTSFSIENFDIILPRETGQKYKCVLIANTRDENMFNEHNRSKFSTLDSLRNFDKDVTNQEDLFKPEEGRYLLMSGWQEITKETTEVKFDLIRNVSKVRVRLTNFPDDLLKPKYFQWCDVPFGKVFPHGTNTNYQQRVSRNWRQHDDFQIIRTDIPDINNDDGYDYYIPCNTWIPMPGEDNGSTDSDASGREEDPTYFDIVCHLNTDNEDINVDDVPIDDHALYKFQIYPSRDKEKQFNFQPNHYYEIDIAINGIPDPEKDPFFNELGYTHLRGSNCYIIDPNAKDVFKLHLDQINKFWQLYEGKDFIGDNSDHKNDEWVAEVIWQDTDVRILDFSFAEDEDSFKDLSKFDGKGNTYFTFCPTGSGVGNVIIGVRKRVPDGEPIPDPDKREYFWSWHIWITDYKPDECPDKWTNSYNELLSDQNVYPVTGGEVHTYTNGSFESTNDNIVKHRFMMDRNLGAWSANPEDGYRTFGFYYQRGRKDPFPIGNTEIQKVYDIDGKEITAFNIGSSNMITASKEVSIAESVNNPYKFVNIANWYNDNFHNKYQSSWFNNETNNTPYTEKCIFDPCPPGWMIPPKEAYEKQSDGTFGERSGGKIYNNLGIIFNFFIGSRQTIWYPFNSTRGTETTNAGYYWVAPTSPSNDKEDAGKCIYNFSDPTVGGDFTSAISSASIRCMRVRTYYKNKDEK